MSKNPVSFRTIAAIVIGNAFEWYDFMVYSFMTLFIAALFFPNIDHTISLLSAYATLGVAFCIRPIGGIFFGVLADKKGRKLAVTVGMAMMTIAMMMIATAHTYAEIGIIAPIYILVARLIQGFSAGGEFGASTALLTELAPNDKRGFYTSWQFFGQCLAIWLGGMMGFLLTHFLSMQQLLDWGWRIPFIFGLIIAPAGVYIRYHLHEEALPVQASKIIKHTGMVSLLRQHIKEIFISIGLIVGGTAANYTIISFLPTYTTILNLPLNSAFIAMGIISTMLVTLIPLFGWLADKFNRKYMMLSALTGLIIFVYPLYFWMVNDPSIYKLYVAEFIFGLFIAAYFGVFTVIVAELFPRAIRATGLSISNNLAVMTFGGFGQLIVTWLIKTTGSSMAPAYYLLPTLSISLLAALLLPTQNRTKENENFGMALAVSSD